MNAPLPWSPKVVTDLSNPEMFAVSPVAVQVQAAREADRRGMLRGIRAQAACDLGLFSTPAADQPDFLSTMGVQR